MHSCVWTEIRYINTAHALLSLEPYAWTPRPPPITYWLTGTSKQAAAARPLAAEASLCQRPSQPTSLQRCPLLETSICAPWFHICPSTLAHGRAGTLCELQHDLPAAPCRSMAFEKNKARSAFSLHRRSSGSSGWTCVFI